jgi:hypothetical protein
MARTVSDKPVMGKYPKPLIHCTGKPETGKTQLAISFALWLAVGQRKKIYVWPTDGREHEYAVALGRDNVLAPVANPLDVSAVQDEINTDLRAKVFDPVAMLSVDTVTHIYRQASTSNQLKGMTGQGSSGHALKAVTMMNVVTIIMAVNLPAMVITHIYSASNKDNLKEKKDRDTISGTEEARWKLAFNIKIETFKDAIGYGVIVRECRERPGMQPLFLRDEPGGMFRQMPARLMKLLYEEAAPANEPKGWADFGLNKPFPDKGEQFKQNAVREMVNYFVDLDGLTFYPFGDPAETPIKKNGEPGVNGAVNHALNAYTKVARAYTEGGGKNLGQLTVKLKEYTEAKVRQEIDAYLDSKVQAAEAAAAELHPEAPPELVEGQAALPLEVPVVGSGGAAYAN